MDNIINIIFTYKLEIIVALLSIIILYLLYFVYEKESYYNRNLRSMASVIEELNRDIFQLQNKLTETVKKIEYTKRNMSDEEIYQEIERTVYDMTKPLVLTIQELQQSGLGNISELEKRIAYLENGVKQINIPSSLHAKDDEKVISLYNQGVSVETIAKELHLSKTEIEFILKINKIK
ncbi:MAG: DUF2802 domain-containing protein [Epsilonproteobacteria bacterium]|nr:DUF2802 domain-containing protein [Campylobacterota bacterium]